MHGHSSKAGAVLRLAQAGKHSPVVYTPHAPITMDPEMSMSSKNPRLSGLAERMLARFCRQIICVSPAERDHLLKLGFAEDKLQVVCNGVEHAAGTFDREAVRARLQIPPEKIVASAASAENLASESRGSCGSRASRWPSRPTRICTLCSSVPARTCDAIRALVAEQGLDEVKVSLTGAASGAELMAAFRCVRAAEPL